MPSWGVVVAQRGIGSGRGFEREGRAWMNGAAEVYIDS